MDRSSALDKLARRTPLACAIFVGVVAALVLLAWATDFRVLLRFAPNGIAMIPVTAVCFILAASSLALSERAAESDITRWVQQLLAIMVAAIAVIEFIEYLYEPSFGIDLIL